MTRDPLFWIIVVGVGAFIAGTAWGWVLHLAFTKPTLREQRKSVREPS